MLMFSLFIFASCGTKAGTSGDRDYISAHLDILDDYAPQYVFAQLTLTNHSKTKDYYFPGNIFSLLDIINNWEEEPEYNEDGSIVIIFEEYEFSSALSMWDWYNTYERSSPGKNDYHEVFGPREEYYSITSKVGNDRFRRILELNPEITDSVTLENIKQSVEFDARVIFIPAGKTVTDCYEISVYYGKESKFAFKKQEALKPSADLEKEYFNGEKLIVPGKYPPVLIDRFHLYDKAIESTDTLYIKEKL